MFGRVVDSASLLDTTTLAGMGIGLCASQSCSKCGQEAQGYIVREYRVQ